MSQQAGEERRSNHALECGLPEGGAVCVCGVTSCELLVVPGPWKVLSEHGVKVREAGQV